MPSWLDVRVWWSRVTRRWRTSLALRTIAITVALSTLAAVIVGATIAVSVGANLFDARRDQLLTLSQNATVQVQLVFDPKAAHPSASPKMRRNPFCDAAF